MIDLILPTVDGREASLQRCIESYVNMAEGAVRPLVVEKSVTCGWGWKVGLSRSDAPYVLLACDDQEALSPGWDKVCIETADADMLACPRVFNPDGSVESYGGDMSAYRHTSMVPKRDWAPVDYTTIPFLNREQIEAIGMIETQYSSDVWISYRGRQLGRFTVLRHGFDVRHHHEQAHRGAGMSQNERDALDEVTMRKELARCESLSQAA